MSRKKDQLDELDLSSENFNALRALTGPHRSTPLDPSAPTFDNLSSFIETPEGIFPKPKRPPKEKQSDETKSRSAERIKDQPQPSTSQTERKRDEVNVKLPKNVITRMEQTVKGPMTFIKKCMDEKSRVKVYTRGAVNVRGFCLGFIVAFDKHMNLVLRDVFETWTRKRKRKVPLLGPITSVEEACQEIESDDCDILSSRFKIDHRGVDRRTHVEKKSKIVVRKRLKRREICERHVDQLLIRGEQIVIVTLEPT